jgi:predicted MPP superfamily phosphohydrolase
MTTSMPRLQEALTAARRLLFSRLFRNLAAALGLMQALVAHWVAVLVGAPQARQVALWCGVALALAAINAALVPPLVRIRNRPGPAAIAVRRYVELGVATLLVGSAVAACWLVLAPIVWLPFFLGLYDAATAWWLFRTASGTGVGLVALSVAWSFTVGQARVAHTRVRVELPGLAHHLAGLRVVQISDLHIGNRLEGGRLARMVERVNETEPDVVAITGDLFDRDPVYLPEAARLGRLRARHGVFAILGNHDANLGADRVADALAQYAPGVRLLRDEMVRLDVHSPLYVAGVEDPGGRWFERGLRYGALEALRASWPGDGPVLLLVHQPEVFENAADLGFPLVLAGHTHGGQLALPTPGGHWNLARAMTPLTRGIYRRGACTLYVNRGLGVGGPAMRFHCSREIATIELATSEARSEALPGEVVRWPSRLVATPNPGSGSAA